MVTYVLKNRGVAKAPPTHNERKPKRSGKLPVGGRYHSPLVSHYIRGCKNQPLEIVRAEKHAIVWLERVLRVYQGAVAGAWKRGKRTWEFRWRESFTSSFTQWILKSWIREGQDKTLKLFKQCLAQHTPPNPISKHVVHASKLMRKLVPKSILYNRDAFIQFALIDRALPTAVGQKTMQKALSEHQSIYTTKHHPPKELLVKWKEFLRGPGGPKISTDWTGCGPTLKFTGALDTKRSAHGLDLFTELTTKAQKTRLTRKQKLALTSKE